MDVRSSVIIGVANGFGAGKPACRNGPEALKALELYNDPKDALHILHWDVQIRANGHTKMIAHLFDKPATLRIFT
jgi:arginase family enzyme